MEKPANIIVLKDENGNDVEFLHTQLLEHEGKDYVMLFPYENEEDENLYILRVEVNDEGKDVFLPVESEDVLKTVFEKFKAMLDKMLKEEFDFN